MGTGDAPSDENTFIVHFIVYRQTNQVKHDSESIVMAN